MDDMKAPQRWTMAGCSTGQTPGLLHVSRWAVDQNFLFDALKTSWNVTKNLRLTRDWSSTWTGRTSITHHDHFGVDSAPTDVIRARPSLFTAYISKAWRNEWGAFSLEPPTYTCECSVMDVMFTTCSDRNQTKPNQTKPNQTVPS